MSGGRGSGCDDVGGIRVAFDFFASLLPPSRETLAPMNFDLDAFLRQSLAEDVGSGDLTAEATLDQSWRARGLLRLRDAGVVGGIAAGLRTFQLLDPSAKITIKHPDGSRVGPATVVGEVESSARVVVTGERVALNLLGRMSGVATLTSQYVDAVKGTGCAIVDTRKTTPLLRALEKQAVVFGGGKNHRFGLFDQVLVKDNHIFLAQATGSHERIAALTRQIRKHVGPGIFVQVEATTQDEALAAATNGADSVLFDNFKPDTLRVAVAAVRAATPGKKLVLEASGGINLTTVRSFAETGVDRLSVGALTHSVKSLDITMDIERI